MAAKSFVVDGTAPAAFKSAVCALLRPVVAVLGGSVDAFVPSSGDARSIVDPKTLITEVTLKKSELLRLDASTGPTVGPRYYRYCAFVTEGVTTPEEIAADIRDSVLDADLSFVSTRGASTAAVAPQDALAAANAEAARFLSVVRDGLASDGGLFVPRAIRRLPTSQARYIAEGADLRYHDVAQIVLERLVDVTQLPAGLLETFVEQAYHASRWASADVCPLTHLHHKHSTGAQWDPQQNVYLLELYHGPTAAFKDFALQLFPYLFGIATAGLGQYMILAATSGDTGVAAIVGFLNAAPDTKVMVLYPNQGVSAVQRVQMQSTDDGTHVRVYGVESDFDFCQNSVKAIFQDSALKQALHESNGLTLSSANSINYGRLIPQVVYYFWAYRGLIKQGSIATYGDAFDVCVPSGNFGNLLSCFVAQKMGLPVRKFILASNVNDVLYDFISTGVYDISNRSLQTTASPSIDILKASNIERLLYFLTNGDTAAVAQHMHDLETKKRFALTADEFGPVKASFWAMRCSEAECADTIHGVFAASGRTRIVDPHTAVGVYAAKRFREAFPQDAQIPLVVASTAHWAKFPEPVLRALEPTHPLVSGLQQHTTADSVRALYTAIASLCPSSPAHVTLDAAVKKAEAGDAIHNRTANQFGEVVAQLKEFAAVRPPDVV